MQMIRISIVNWEKFNPRSDRANYSWFRFQNDFFHDQNVFGIGNVEKLLFIFICCEASKKNSAAVELRLDYISANLRVPQDEIQKAITAIKDAALVEIVDVSCHQQKPSSKPQKQKRPTKSRHDDGKQPSLIPATLRDETERNETNVTNETEESPERNEPDGQNGNETPPNDDATILQALKPFDPESKLRLTFSLRNVTKETQQAFLDAYPDPKWVAQQAFKALAWEVMNPAKKKKNFPRFLGNWLSRGWDEHTSKIPSNLPPGGKRWFQRPIGSHERGDDVGAMIEQVKTEVFNESNAGGFNAALG